MPPLEMRGYDSSDSYCIVLLEFRLRLRSLARKCAQVKRSRVVLKYVAAVSTILIVGTDVCGLGLGGMKHDSPYFFAETLWNSTALGTRSRLLAISTRYSFPSFLNTSETTELSLDFSTGVVVDGVKLSGLRSVQTGSFVP